MWISLGGSGIRVTKSNASKIEEWLLRENGAAKKYTYTSYDQIAEVVKKANAKINSVGLTVAQLSEARIKAISGKNLKGRFRQGIYRTKIQLRRGQAQKSWVLEEADRIYGNSFVEDRYPIVYLESNAVLYRVRNSLRARGIQTLKEQAADRDYNFEGNTEVSSFVDGSNHIGLPLWAESIESEWDRIGARKFYMYLLPSGQSMVKAELLSQLDLGKYSQIEVIRDLSPDQCKGIAACVKWFEAGGN